jgi:hypothetical protein
MGADQTIDPRPACSSELQARNGTGGEVVVQPDLAVSSTRRQTAATRSCRSVMGALAGMARSMRYPRSAARSTFPFGVVGRLGRVH